MKKNLNKKWTLRSARGFVAIAAVSTLAACLGTGDYDFFNDPSANNSDLLDEVTGGGGSGGGEVPPPPGAPIVSYATDEECDVDSTAATPCVSDTPSVSSVDDPTVDFTISSTDTAAGFTVDASTGVVTAGALARSIMTPVAGRTITVTATNDFGSSTADVVFVIGTAQERTYWNNVKGFLSTALTDGSQTNGQSCITCHSPTGSQSGRPWADAATSPTQWYCKNIRNKANPIGWMAVTGATAATHRQGTATSSVDHEHANCLTLAASGCSSGGAAWSVSAYTGTAGTGTANAGVRDSRLLEKIRGVNNSSVYAGFTGNQMPPTNAAAPFNYVKIDSAGQATYTEAMLNDWFDAGAPCEP